MKIWYLAHPVAPDMHRTFEQNMESILHYIRLLHSNGIHVQAPYYGNLAAGLPDSDPIVRRAGIEENKLVLRGYDGMVLCGHKMSSGMAEEYDAWVGTVLNFIDKTDREILDEDLASLYL